LQQFSISNLTQIQSIMSITESTRISNELFHRLNTYTMGMAQIALRQWLQDNDETIDDRHIFNDESFMNFKEHVTDSINEGVTELCFRHFHSTIGADESFDYLVKDVIQALWELDAENPGPIFGY
jgi:hypothetical protein